VRLFVSKNVSIAHQLSASYDYGSAIGEARTLNEKYTELKLQGLFLRSSPAFTKTNVVGNSSAASGAVHVSDDMALVVQLKNPDTGTGFWIARQSDSTSTCVPLIMIYCATAH
jgi:hypothetical protein